MTRPTQVQCPACGAVPGRRCRSAAGRPVDPHRARTAIVAVPAPRPAPLERPCFRCRAAIGEPCRRPSGRPAAGAHRIRVAFDRWEQEGERVSGKGAWEGLNQRQKTYLEVLYDADQDKEAERAALGARGMWSRTPARTWRRIDFNTAHSTVASRLRAAGVYDSGAGSTLKVLSERGLVELGYTPGLLGGELVHVWMTRAGRAAVRAGVGGGPVRETRPKWAVSEWSWRWLVAVAGAGPAGVLESQLKGNAHLYLVGDGPQSRGYLESRVEWVRYRGRDLQGRPWPYEESRPVYRYVFTAAGRAHYVERLEEYRRLYPDVQAPDAHVPDIES